MKTVCAWCGTVIIDGDGLISHGICTRCRTAFSSAEGLSLQSLVDRLDFPVVVLNGSLEPLSTNKAGMETFNLLEGEAAQCTLGEIVECDNAALSGGCGRTIHCSGCVLRRTATDTFNSGQMAAMVPATLESGSNKVSYFVSTVKVGGCVVIKLEKAEN